MPLADLLATLERDASAEASAITGAAATDVARIDEESARATREALARAVRTAAEAQQLTADARLAAARQTHRRAVLGARAAMLERLREAVRAELPGIVDAALRARLLAAAQTYGDGTVHEVPTGVVVELADGTRIDATLEAALERRWPRLAAEALHILDREGS